MKTSTIDLSNYPANWNGYVGQTQTVRELKLAIASARFLAAPMKISSCSRTLAWPT